MVNGIPPSLSLLLGGWKAPQLLLPEVIRWKPYLELRPDIRRQDCLQHVGSICLLGTMIVSQLQAHVELDGGMVLAALIVHDLGEGELGFDTPWVHKSTTRDAEEYLAFRSKYEVAHPESFPYLHEAFLLQFCLANPPEFPEEARQIMMWLAEHKRMEALAFEAIERWDYILYALEQYQERSDARILFEVLRNQTPLLERVAEELPGFRKSVWTAEVVGWFRSFNESYCYPDSQVL